jgi:methionyl-tRNA formyltransferase
MLYATKVRIFDARLTALDAMDAAPGTILAANDEQIDIQLMGGVLHAQRLQRVGGKKLRAGEFAAEMGIEPGDGFEPPAA